MNMQISTIKIITKLQSQAKNDTILQKNKPVFYDIDANRAWLFFSGPDDKEKEEIVVDSFSKRWQKVWEFKGNNASIYLFNLKNDILKYYQALKKLKQMDKK